MFFSAIFHLLSSSRIIIDLFNLVLCFCSLSLTDKVIGTLPTINDTYLGQDVFHHKIR